MSATLAATGIDANSCESCHSPASKKLAVTRLAPSQTASGSQCGKEQNTATNIAIGPIISPPPITNTASKTASKLSCFLFPSYNNFTLPARFRRLPITLPTKNLSTDRTIALMGPPQSPPLPRGADIRVRARGPGTLTRSPEQIPMDVIVKAQALDT